MGVHPTAGVEALCDMLNAVARCGPVTIGELCSRERIPRSSGFTIARKLLDAGFLVRLPRGRIAIGPQAVHLAFARYGLASLAGPAVPVVQWAARTGDAVVRLHAGDTTLVAAPAPFSGPVLSRRDIRDRNGASVACLEAAGTRNGCDPVLLATALDRAALTLEHHLALEPNE